MRSQPLKGILVGTTVAAVVNAALTDGQDPATLDAETLDGLRGDSFARGPGAMATFRETPFNDETKTLVPVPGIGQFQIRGNGASARIVFLAAGQRDYFDNQGNYVTLYDGAYRTVFYESQDRVRTSIRVLVTSPGHVGTFDLALMSDTGQILQVMIQGVCT
jgi:hypothetical protein